MGSRPREGRQFGQGQRFFFVFIAVALVWAAASLSAASWASRSDLSRVVLSSTA